jgi:hypothetical protein
LAFDSRAQAFNLGGCAPGTCVAVAREVPADEGLSDESYAAAEKTIGLESLLVLVATVGSLSMTCLAAATFQIDPSWPRYQHCSGAVTVTFKSLIRPFPIEYTQP